MKNQRKLRNAIVDSKVQLRMLVPYLIMIVAAIVEIIILNFTIIRIIGTEIAVEDHRAMSIFTMIATRIQIWSVIAMFITGLIGFALWIVYSHRVQGPTYAINQHLKKLLDGNYGDKIQLREKDELTEIADNINRLTKRLNEQFGEQLGEKSTSSTTPNDQD